ncbi:MAG: ABC transporter substrate-binding protein [Nocardioides sp.]
MRFARLSSLTALAAASAFALTACGVEDEPETATSADCATDQLDLLTPGTLTIATDSPAYEPWFVDNDPTNSKGYESAVAYAVADQLGFSADQVDWVTMPFNKSFKPGAERDFDFDINQISISPERAEVVDFSEGYYTAAQAVITLPENADGASSLAGLKDLKLGAQTGTTSLTAIREEVQPSQEPLVFDNTNVAKQALMNGQVDAIVADLPTALYITAVEIPDGVIAGQFASTSDPEEFGLLFEKGNPLLVCVNQALDTLTADGTLADLEDTWLSSEISVPVLK